MARQGHGRRLCERIPGVTTELALQIFAWDVRRGNEPGYPCGRSACRTCTRCRRCTARLSHPPCQRQTRASIHVGRQTAKANQGRHKEERIQGDWRHMHVRRQRAERTGGHVGEAHGVDAHALHARGRSVTSTLHGDARHCTAQSMSIMGTDDRSHTADFACAYSFVAGAHDTEQEAERCREQRSEKDNRVCQKE
eukprot:1294737-Rhodomonas_salina.4